MWHFPRLAGPQRLAVALALAAVPAPSLAQIQPAALRGMLPDEVALAVEIETPAAAMRALAHALGSVPADLPVELVARVAVGLTALQFALGHASAAWLEQVAGHGAVFGLLPTPRELQWLAAALPGDLLAAQRWCERFPERVHFVVVDEVLLLGSTSGALELLRAQAAAPASRWAAVDFSVRASDFGAREVADKVGLVRGACDLGRLRQLLGAAAPGVERLDGPGRFLLAPIAHALAAADWLHFAVSGGERIVLEARADAAVRTTPFGGLLAPGERAAPPPLANGLAYFTLDRCLANLLRDPERYLPAADVLGVQGFLSIADALDGAQSSFVDDLLGGLEEPFAVHVTPAASRGSSPGSSLSGEGETPPLVLPGIAIVARLADAAVEPILFRMAQVLATIVNTERAQRGESVFLVRRRHGDLGEALVAEPAPWRGPGRPPIESALSPTLWCGQGHVVLATTEDAAAIVSAQIGAAQIVAAEIGWATAPQRADVLALRGPAIAGAIADNRLVLELGRVLDEGEDLPTARRFFDAAIAVASALREVTLRCEVGESHTAVQLTVERVR